MFPELLNDYRLDGCAWGNYRRDVQDSDMPLRVLWIVRMMTPGVNPICLRMPRQMEDLNNSVPHRLSLKALCYRHALQMLGFSTVKVMNHVPKLLNVRRHATASSKSPTLQNDCSTPAAMAGVQRSVL